MDGIQLMGILGGLIVLIVLFALLMRKKCPKCGESAFFIKKCDLCYAEICDSCKTFYFDVYFCSDHKDAVKGAIENYQSVRTYSRNYKGKIPPNKFNKSINSSFYKDKEEAETQLKFIAAMHGAVTISNFKYNSKKRSSGNYIYSVWQAQGEI